MDNSPITVMAYSKDSFMSRKVADLESALQFAEYPTVWVNVTGFSAIPKLEKLLDLRETRCRALTPHPRSSAQYTLHETHGISPA